MEQTKTIEDVRQFWEANPLWTGEGTSDPGTRQFFEQHASVVIRDCFAGEMDERIFNGIGRDKKVLDLGCGPGFWLVEFAKRGFTDINGADIAQAALALARKRCEIFGASVKFFNENAESLSFGDATFSHVNCQGVIHHTPNTEKCIAEIARVLASGGTASISVYYKNWILRQWPHISWIGKLLYKLGAKLPGRGREEIFAADDVNQIVRLYDGHSNPIGKAYSRAEFINMLAPHFEVLEVFYHFFPARALPFPVPRFLHRILDRKLPFMIYVSLKKK